MLSISKKYRFNPIKWQLTLLGLCSYLFLIGQTITPKANLTLGIEYRPRTELRYGYRKLPTINAQPAFFTSHRARLNLGYESEKINFFVALQDIRLWGEEATRNRFGTFQVFEFYAMPQINDHWSMKIGRQRLSFDDERFFAQNNWRQTAGKHDGINLIYRNSSLSFDLFTAYNQSSQSNFGNYYQPDFVGYKFLTAHLMTIKINTNTALITTNFIDGYQGNNLDSKTYFKITNGIKLQSKLKDKTHLSMSFFTQNGKLPTAQKLRAWFYDFQLKYPFSPKYQLRGGIQYFSGGSTETDEISTAFVAQYGAFHKFNGRMDYTAKTVNTYNHEGLINPHIIQDIQVSPRIKFSLETHLLGEKAGFYALENDLRVMLNLNTWTQLEIAYMNLASNNKIDQLPTSNSSNSRRVGHFFYIQALWKNPVKKLKDLF